MAEKIEITVTRQHSGLLLSTIYAQRRIKKLFVGYTVREAKKEFRSYVKEEAAK